MTNFWESKKSAKQWSKYYQNISEKTYPNETIIRLFKGSFLSDMFTNFTEKKYKNKKILEVSCGVGQNFPFYKDLGLRVYGTEIHSVITKILKKKYPYSTFKVGTNLCLPFPDNTFDFLVSWASIHYVEKENLYRKCLEEHKRVLKKNGRFIIGTAGPHHRTRLKEKKISKFIFKMTTEDSKKSGYSSTTKTDPRKGKLFFFFSKIKDIKSFYSRYFVSVEVGRVKHQLLSITNDYYLITGKKGR